jgi:uncharacterized protein (TIGR03086 family)
VTAGHPPALAGGVGLLERAINYTLGTLRAVTDAELAAPTPCRAWDLRALLTHLDESLAALHEAAALGRVELSVPQPRAPADPVAAVRDRASLLLGAWTSARHTDAVIGAEAGDAALTTAVLASAGALEIAVHGWDVARSVGRGSPLPPALAEEMLALTPYLVSAADRPVRFAAPVALPPRAPAGERLLAFLGRRP